MNESETAVGSAAEPPVIQGDSIFVECSNSSCDRTTMISTTIDAVEADDNRGLWRISFLSMTDGRLAIDNVECPDHRVADAIDDLANQQISFASQMAKVKHVADDLAPDDSPS